MRLVWKGLPAQLAKENGKLVYGAVRPGARACDFEESIRWLVDYGAVRRISRSSALCVPLAAYRDEGAFKLFRMSLSGYRDEGRLVSVPLWAAAVPASFGPDHERVHPR